MLLHYRGHPAEGGFPMMTLLYILMAASFASSLFRIIDRIEGRR